MPFTYFRDDARRRIRITLTDPLRVADMTLSLDRQLTEGTWDYGVLLDGRAIAAGVPSSDIQSFLSQVRELIAKHGPRGPVAFVATQSAAIGSAQRYLLFGGGAAESFEIFWAIDDANRWLDEQSAGKNQP